MLTQFDHVTIAVRELESGVAEYARLLGIEPTWRGEYAGAGLLGAHFALSNAIVELVAPKPEADEAEGLRQHLDAHGEGMQAIAFRTADAVALRSQLKEHGYRATEPQDGEARAADGSVRRYRTVELSPRSTRGVSVFAVERALDQLPKAAAEPAPERVSALDHVVIRTADPEAALALYGRALGVRLALDRTFGDLRALFFRIGGVTLEVVHDPSVGERDAFYGAAYRVRDLPGAHARLAAAGLDVSELRDGRKPGTQVFTVRSGTCRVRTLMLRDPARDS